MVVGDGRRITLRNFVIFKLHDEGIECTVWAFACPTESDRLSLLLEVLCLNDVNAQIDMRNDTITIGVPELEEPIIKLTPRFHTSQTREVVPHMENIKHGLWQRNEQDIGSGEALGSDDDDSDSDSEMEDFR